MLISAFDSSRTTFLRAMPNIVGWPEEKDAVIEKAQDLSACAIDLKLTEEL